MIDNIKEKYSVGALLYSPALNSGVAGRVISGEFGSRYSLALCLEDTISPDLVPRAENQVRETLERIYRASREQEMSVPRIFVRVREPEQAERLEHKQKRLEAAQAKQAVKEAETIIKADKIKKRQNNTKK